MSLLRAGDCPPRAPARPRPGARARAVLTGQPYSLPPWVGNHPTPSQRPRAACGGLWLTGSGPLAAPPGCRTPSVQARPAPAAPRPALTPPGRSD